MKYSLTGELSTVTLTDGLYGWVGDGGNADEFVELALAEYGRIIEDVTGGTWARPFNEVWIDTELPEEWENVILERIEQTDLESIHKEISQ